jgi:ArsR family transcriptional regulator, arsenate/arsenite/antimonite-responsive transcriptional repressor / arsenate reductase (thioredoxin)
MLTSATIASILMEGNVTLEYRAKMHAALGEPVRLAIAEGLVLSDRSPGELAEQLDLTSNLLAHHLRVLEDAGLIRRRRSEGDHRRSYVQLCLDNPEVMALLSLEASPVSSGGSRVVFVCTQNSARSQLAAAAWRRVSPTPALSAGTHPAARVHPRALTTGRRHGFRLGRARTAHVEDVLGPDDLVVAVCDSAYEELAISDGIHARLHWAVPDPVRTDTDAAFEAAYEEIHQRVGRLAAALHPAIVDTTE